MSDVTHAPKVSVIIPTKNPGAIIRAVLPAVCAQKTDFAFDILVIDSGSTDGTQEYVRSLDDERVRLHVIPAAEFGHGKTRNLAISLTEGEYAVLITHDALPASERWLDAMVRMADCDPQIAGVFGRHLAYPEANPFTRRDLLRHFQGFESTPVVWMDDPVRYKSDEGYRQLLHFFSDNNALVRRSVWKSIPYPDVDFAEDQIWAEKVIQAGWKKAYSSDGAVFHSHDFGIFERLQRSFDESYALYRLFGYVLSPSLFRMVRSWLWKTKIDAQYAIQEHLLKDHRRAVVIMPIDNLMLCLGHYLGSRGDRLPLPVRRWLSRDRRMMNGLAIGRKRAQTS
jgi:rhamnosyltransferase